MIPRFLLLTLLATQAVAEPPALDVPRNRIHDYTFWGIRSSAVSPDGKLVASSFGDHTFKIWDVATGTERVTPQGHNSFVHALAFSPDGKRVASGVSERGNPVSIVVRDAATGKSLLTLNGHSHSVHSLHFSPDDRRLVSASEDGSVMLWDVSPGE